MGALRRHVCGMNVVVIMAGMWLIPIIVSHGAINREVLADVTAINTLGPYLGIVVPNLFELQPLLDMDSFTQDTSSNHSTIVISGRKFYMGEIEGQRVILVLSGLGMTNTAITTQLLITYFSLKGILHYGIGGNANDDLHIGDITIAQYWAHTGIWNWERYTNSSNKLLHVSDTETFNGLKETKLATLAVGDYNNPLGDALNYLGDIVYRTEEVYMAVEAPETSVDYFWVPVDQVYFEKAKQIPNQHLDLQYCTNESTCLSTKPQVVVVSRGSSSNIFLDNAAYRSFLHETFNISVVDMESASVALTCLTNNVSFIAFRALSDLAGGSSVSNEESIFYDLAATNAALVLTEFIKLLGE